MIRTRISKNFEKFIYEVFFERGFIGFVVQNNEDKWQLDTVVERHFPKETMQEVQAFIDSLNAVNEL